jgi:hypothetical protein
MLLKLASVVDFSNMFAEFPFKFPENSAEKLNEKCRVWEKITQNIPKPICVKIHFSVVKSLVYTRNLKKLPKINVT